MGMDRNCLESTPCPIWKTTGSKKCMRRRKKKHDFSLQLDWRLMFWGGVLASVTERKIVWSKLMHVTSILERGRRELKESVSLIVQICETKIAEYQRRGTNYLTWLPIKTLLIERIYSHEKFSAFCHLAVCNHTNQSPLQEEYMTTNN